MEQLIPIIDNDFLSAVADKLSLRLVNPSKYVIASGERHGSLFISAAWTQDDITKDATISFTSSSKAGTMFVITVTASGSTNTHWFKKDLLDARRAPAQISEVWVINRLIAAIDRATTFTLQSLVNKYTTGI
jgi:hypothetical protein